LINLRGPSIRTLRIGPEARSTSGLRQSLTVLARPDPAKSVLDTVQQRHLTPIRQFRQRLARIVSI